MGPHQEYFPLLCEVPGTENLPMHERQREGPMAFRLSNIEETRRGGCCKSPG